MIVVRFKGGLGNQLFQYAAGRALAERHGVPLCFDTRWYEQPEHQVAVRRSFDLMHFAVHGRVADTQDLRPFRYVGSPRKALQIVSRLIQPLVGHRIWGYEGMGFNSDFERLGAQVLIEGYFQDPRYFPRVQHQLREELQMRMQPPADVLSYAAQMSSVASVCIQVRRTDFISNPQATARHGCCDLEYFKRAWADVSNRIPNVVGFVFADDPVWACAAFSNWPGVSVVGPEWDGPAYLHKFFLMQSCRHFIIANSTWGWWAAWLARFPGKTVVMPERWFADLKLNEEAAGLQLPGWSRC